MAENKTQKTKASVEKFIDSIEHETRREDAKVLLAIFKKVTGEKPVMWGTRIVGFGEYHYKSTRSSQEGDWPLTGFGPGKTKMSLYIMAGPKKFPKLLEKLGKHKASVGCLYINKLADVDLKVLEKLIKESFEYMKTEYKHC